MEASVMNAENSVFSGIKENFQFLILEVSKTVQDTRSVLLHESDELVEKIVGRDDYIDNLKSRIENKCFLLLGNERIPKPTVDLVRAVSIITSNLERIADYAVNIVGQSSYLGDIGCVARFGPEPFFTEILDTLGLVFEALFGRDLSTGLRICRSELLGDRLYDEVFRRILDELRGGAAPEDLVTTLFIYRYLERMTDDLLNIGEAILFACVGEKIKVSQYQALEETLASSGMDLSVAEADTTGIWETRSGCRIYTVSDGMSDEPARWVVFKEGRLPKVRAEKEALERWEAVVPGLPPRVFGFQERGNKAALLLEYLGGNTLQRILLDGSPEETRAAFALLEETLVRAWDATRQPGPANARFLGQLRGRIQDVYNIHPGFRFPLARMPGVEWKSYEELLDLCEPIDRSLDAPFSVLIHGDFNLDNIIVDERAGRVHFIDLHRSEPSDYVQDVSVLLVSHFRMPVFETSIRDRLNGASLAFYRFAHRYAAERGDRTFDARLALGLVRSFTTSTRFELNVDFAKTMFLRAVHLLNLLVDRPGGPFDDFALPEDILVY